MSEVTEETTMIIRVMHEDGRSEVLALALPFAAREGTLLDCLTTADGVDHYFTKDGYYDGWGRAVSSEAEAQHAIRVHEEGRHIEG